MTAARLPIILCVDDEEGVRRVLRQQLGSRFGDRCQITTAASGDEALLLLEELYREGEEVAVVLADQIMPGLKGTELLEQIDTRWPQILKVLLTGQAGLDAVVRAINQARLAHYIAKPWDETNLFLVVDSLLRRFALEAENRRLVARLSQQNDALTEMNRELEAKIHERTHELAEANSRLAQLAVTDGLTGLYNHRHFHERLGLEVERSQRSGLPLSLLMIDVDHFKHYNDTYGHPAGDEILRRLATVFTEGRRANDVVARYGGEEFAIILVDTAKFTAAKVAEKIREQVLAHPFPSSAHTAARKVSISVGVATYPDDARDAEQLVRVADTALYAAKHAGRNRIALASGAAMTDLA